MTISTNSKAPKSFKANPNLENPATNPHEGLQILERISSKQYSWFEKIERKCKEKREEKI